jgi:hypothetical protein
MSGNASHRPGGKRSGLGRCEVTAQGCIGSIGFQEPTLDEEEIGTLRQDYDLGDVLFGKGAMTLPPTSSL